MNMEYSKFVFASAWAGASLLLPSLAMAQPTPLSLASQIDLECRRAEGPPPANQLPIRQLNPVLKAKLPAQQVRLGALADVCVPVAKDGNLPSEDARPIIEWTDLACYRASAPPVDVTVELRHLNPVLADLPDETVRLTEVEEVCVPVRKNQSNIPEGVRRYVQHFDFACYGLEEPTSVAGREVRLSHLNPVIQGLGFEPREMVLRRARRLCVPIRKGNQFIPEDVLARLEWLDFLKYGLAPRTQADAAAAPPFDLQLTHLNPFFSGIPPFYTTLRRQPKLMVPVAKDGQLPPGGSSAGD